jgi:hypothetical protein
LNDAELHEFAEDPPQVIDNTPKEIRDLVIGMIETLEGHHVPTEHERAMQRRFADIMSERKLYLARLSRAFMSRYPQVVR